jgi:hypothetical protein
MFQYQPPRFEVDANPFGPGANALAQGIGDLNQARQKARVREEGRAVANALAGGNYADAMRASSSPETALGIGQYQASLTQAQQAAEQRRLQFQLQQQEAQRQANQFQQSFGLQKRQVDSDEAYKSAQAKALGEKDATREMIRRMLIGEDAPQQQPSMAPSPQGGQPQQQPMPAPRMQNQSFDANAPDGQVILAQSTPGPQAPAGPRSQQQPEATVEVFGRRVPISRARTMAQSMLMDPQYAALGKAIMDSIPAAQGALGKEASNELDKKQLNATEQFARLKSIEEKFKPEFMDIETRVGMRFDRLIDSFKAGTLSPEKQKQLGDYAVFRATALDNLSQYIKEITGAAMTDAEAKRITASLPDPGQGVFDGDNKTDFAAKLKMRINDVKLSFARYNYLRKKGFNNVEDMAKEVPLERMSNIIQQRTDDLTIQIEAQNPGIPPEALKPLVKQRVRSEFGIDS